MLNHVCEQKRKVLQREERQVVQALCFYQLFWKRKQNPKHMPGWAEFEKSSLYSAFVRFARKVSTDQVQNPIGFVEYLLRTNTGIDDWCKDICYEKYIRELTKAETPFEALERNILLMEQWANEVGEHWTDFFRKVPPTRAVLWLKSGRLSPLMFFVASSAHELISRLNTEQIQIVESMIDEKFWEAKMTHNKTDIDTIVNELKELNI